MQLGSLAVILTVLACSWHQKASASKDHELGVAADGPYRRVPGERHPGVPWLCSNRQRGRELPCLSYLTAYLRGNLFLQPLHPHGGLSLNKILQRFPWRARWRSAQGPSSAQQGPANRVLSMMSHADGDGIHSTNATQLVAYDDNGKSSETFWWMGSKMKNKQLQTVARRTGAMPLTSSAPWPGVAGKYHDNQASPPGLGWREWLRVYQQAAILPSDLDPLHSQLPDPLPDHTQPSRLKGPNKARDHRTSTFNGNPVGTIFTYAQPVKAADAKTIALDAATGPHNSNIPGSTIGSQESLDTDGVEVVTSEHREKRDGDSQMGSSSSSVGPEDSEEVPNTTSTATNELTGPSSVSTSTEPSTVGFSFTGSSSSLSSASSAGPANSNEEPNFPSTPISNGLSGSPNGSTSPGSDSPAMMFEIWGVPVDLPWLVAFCVGVLAFILWQAVFICWCCRRYRSTRPTPDLEHHPSLWYRKNSMVSGTGSMGSSVGWNQHKRVGQSDSLPVVLIDPFSNPFVYPPESPAVITAQAEDSSHHNGCWSWLRRKKAEPGLPTTAFPPQQPGAFMDPWASLSPLQQQQLQQQQQQQGVFPFSQQQFGSPFNQQQQQQAVMVNAFGQQVRWPWPAQTTDALGRPVVDGMNGWAPRASQSLPFIEPDTPVPPVGSQPAGKCVSIGVNTVSEFELTNMLDRALHSTESNVVVPSAKASEINQRFTDASQQTPAKPPIGEGDDCDCEDDEEYMEVESVVPAPAERPAPMRRAQSAKAWTTEAVSNHIDQALRGKGRRGSGQGQPANNKPSQSAASDIGEQKEYAEEVPEHSGVRSDSLVAAMMDQIMGMLTSIYGKLDSPPVSPDGVQVETTPAPVEVPVRDGQSVVGRRRGSQGGQPTVDHAHHLDRTPHREVKVGSRIEQGRSSAGPAQGGGGGVSGARPSQPTVHKGHSRETQLSATYLEKLYGPRGQAGPLTDKAATLLLQGRTLAQIAQALGIPQADTQTVFKMLTDLYLEGAHTVPLSCLVEAADAYTNQLLAVRSYLQQHDVASPAAILQRLPAELLLDENVIRLALAMLINKDI